MADEMLGYYAQPGMMTALDAHRGWLADLPDTAAGVSEVVQGLLLHVFWAQQAGVKPPESRMGELEIRSAARMLAGVRALDSRLPTAARPPDKRLLGNCRDFATLATALLRWRGIPARARCGFSTYFEAGRYIDHWIAEVWDAGAERWVAFDPQIDAMQRKVLGLDFDPLNVPRHRFLPAGEGWRLCRAGQADPETFGIAELWGLWFVRGNVVRDVAALNKVELLPWDCWGLIEEEGTTDAASVVLDQAAALSLAVNDRFDDLRALYENEPGLRVPPVIRSYTRHGLQDITLADETAVTPS